jgi:hypothetical protein
MPRASRAYRCDAIDPNVWSGRALQEDFFELADLRSRGPAPQRRVRAEIVAERIANEFKRNV